MKTKLNTVKKIIEELKIPILGIKLRHEESENYSGISIVIEDVFLEKGSNKVIYAGKIPYDILEVVLNLMFPIRTLNSLNNEVINTIGLLGKIQRRTSKTLSHCEQLSTGIIEPTLFDFGVAISNSPTGLLGDTLIYFKNYKRYLAYNNLDLTRPKIRFKELEAINLVNNYKKWSCND